jgi:hypothetical protein
MFTKVLRKTAGKAPRFDFSTLVIAEHRNSKLSTNLLKVLAAANHFKQEV